MSLNLTEAMVCYNDLDAEIAKGVLEKNGIDVFLVKDDCGGMEPQLQMTEGIKILVPSVYHEDALKLLTTLEKPANDQGQESPDSWKCSRCGELLEAQFTDCWNCGAPRDEEINSAVSKNSSI